MPFRLQSLLVKADHYGRINEGHPWRLVHACAGCQDPFFEPKGLLSLAMRFYPEQLQEADESGNLPLHIAVSTVNRDKNEYYEPFWDLDNEIDDELYVNSCLLCQSLELGQCEGRRKVPREVDWEQEEVLFLVALLNCTRVACPSPRAWWSMRWLLEGCKRRRVGAN